MPFEIVIDPVAFRLGGLAVHWYGIIVVLASAAAVAVVLREARRLGIAREAAEDAAVWLALAALIGGRFGLFFLRDEPSVLFGLKTAQLIGIVIAVLAVALIVTTRRSERLTPIAHAPMEASQP